MNPLTWFLFGQTVCVVILVPLAIWLHRKYLGLAIDTATTYLRGQLNDMSDELELARLQRDTYFTKIDSIANERDIWIDLHNREAIGHGNAQNMMMGTIDALGRQLVALGERPKIPRVIQEVREEYQAAFETPAREKVAQLETERAKAQKTS